MKLRCHPIVVSCLLAVTVLPSAAVPAGLPVTGQPWESALCKGTAAVMHCAAALLSASCSAAAVINCAAGLLLASCSVAMTVPPSAAMPAAGLPVTCQTLESDLLKGSTAIHCHCHTLHCHPAVSVLLSSCCNTLRCQPASSLLGCCDRSVISCCASYYIACDRPDMGIWLVQGHCCFHTLCCHPAVSALLLGWLEGVTHRLEHEICTRGRAVLTKTLD